MIDKLDGKQMYNARVNIDKIIPCLGGSEWLGRYLNETDAARAYNKRASELWGIDAKLNDV